MQRIHSHLRTNEYNVYSMYLMTNSHANMYNTMLFPSSALSNLLTKYMSYCNSLPPPHTHTPTPPTPSHTHTHTINISLLLRWCSWCYCSDIMNIHHPCKLCDVIHSNYQWVNPQCECVTPIDVNSLKNHYHDCHHDLQLQRKLPASTTLHPVTNSSESSIERFLDHGDTVWCRYNAFNFLENTERKPPISRPLGSVYGFTVIYSASVTAVIYIISSHTGPRYNGTWLCMELSVNILVIRYTIISMA